MGIGQTLEAELDEKGLESISDLKEFDVDDENTALWSGILIHPMCGYAGNFDYLDIAVTLTKEGPNKYVVEQDGKRISGKLPRYIRRKMEEDDDYELDEYDLQDFDGDEESIRGDREEFKTLEEAKEYIDSDACLDYQG